MAASVLAQARTVHCVARLPLAGRAARSSRHSGLRSISTGVVPLAKSVRIPGGARRSNRFHHPHVRAVAVDPSVSSQDDACEPRPVRHVGLVGDDFRHPLDLQNTRMLSSLPGMTSVAKNLMGPAAENLMLLENIGTSVLVGPNQLTNLHNLMIEAADILGLESPPDLYVRQDPVPNAYTLAISGRKPFIVVHTALVELLTPAELQAVIAHEMGHLKCDHGVWLTFANFFALSAVNLPVVGAFVAANVEESLMRWLRSAELTCDRASLLVAQDAKVVVSLLMKLAGGAPSLAEHLNVDAFLEQARSYDEASSSPLGWYLRNAQTRQLSHPLPVMRAREIERWSESPQYKAILERSQKRARSAGEGGASGRL